MNAKLDFVKRDYSLSYSNVALKSSKREELEEEVAKWLAQGNEIKPFEKKEQNQIRLKHGTDGAYKKMGCRCKTCVVWARSNGILLTEPKKEKVKVVQEQSAFAKLQQKFMHVFVEEYGQSWDFLAERSGYAITAYQLRRIYEGQSEATVLDWNILKNTLNFLDVHV
ncbi:hypothetical protein [Acinetobacter baumannii]|uniref:hypothetical protein n=1 Tax=Acinetobacter baumannii TaxID=470 RepID=UPI00112A0F57|nr:hypothetical protein [Acinetobacter baumannii]TPT55493.1 hypothetical protein FJU64_08165 [Acinetobacter baumannii]